VSPAGIVVAALAALAYEAYRLYGAWKTMKEAQAQEKASEAQQKAAQKTSQDMGYINEGQVARRLGFTDEQFEAGLKPEDSARVHAEFLRLRAVRRGEWQAQAQRPAESALAQAGFGFGTTGTAAAAATQYGVPEDALAAARQTAQMDYRRTSGGVAGAQEYLGYVQTQAQKDLAAAQATGDKDKIAKAQEEAAKGIAEAEIGVEQERADERERLTTETQRAQRTAGAGGRQGWRTRGGLRGTTAGLKGTATEDMMAPEEEGWGEGGATAGGVQAPALQGQGYGKVLNFTIYVNDGQRVGAIVDAKLDEAFP